MSHKIILVICSSIYPFIYATKISKIQKTIRAAPYFLGATLLKYTENNQVNPEAQG